MPPAANRQAAAGVYTVGVAVMRCGQYETFMFLWLLMF